MIVPNQKIVLLSLGLAILSFAFFLPLYTGAFTNSDFTRCDACHVQEKDEFSRTSPHKSMKCTSCHNISDFAPDLVSHNATTVACTNCHEPGIERNSYKGMNVTASSLGGYWKTQVSNVYGDKKTIRYNDPGLYSSMILDLNFLTSGLLTGLPEGGRELVFGLWWFPISLMMYTVIRIKVRNKGR
jgi:hypothetical protein